MNSVLPNQKLTIGELFVSLAAGLMLYLLPKDAQVQMEDAGAEGFILVFTLVIIIALMIVIKRYQAAGAALLSMSVITASSFVIDIFEGIFTEGSNYWPGFTEYNLVSMFILWTVPFFVVVGIRVLSVIKDSNESRKSFVRFLSLSMRALMVIYILVIVFRMLIPAKPDLMTERTVNMTLFGRISDCLSGQHENGGMYLWWHSLILAPLTFSLLILNPHIKLWHLAIISGSLGLTIEVIQYSFNTSTACLDDLLMYMIGAVVGVFLKKLIDYVRSLITSGEENCMLSLTYTPMPRKKTPSVKVLTEEE